MIDLNSLVAETLKFGFPGVIIICMAWFVLELRKEIKSEREKHEASQEKRIAEGRESLMALQQSTAVLDDLVKAVADGKGGK